jgi:hypothetical protein
MENFRCSICSTEFASRNKLFQHLSTGHKTATIGDSKCKNIDCVDESEDENDESDSEELIVLPVEIIANTENPLSH